MVAVERPEERIRVLIVDDVAETRENLRKLLSFDPDIEVVAMADTGEEGVQLAKEIRPHVVLMDINLPGMDGITATEQIVREVPTAQVVILSVQGETGYMRRAMAAGARDYLVKPPSGDELVNAIRRAYEIGKVQAARIVPPITAELAVGGHGGPSRRGRLITVFAPKGGVGCTTVAVNLAVALQERLGGEKKVALFDGSLQFGDVGVMLNLQTNRSLADLAGRIEELDADLLTSVLTPHPTGVKVLLAPPHPEAAESLRTTDGDEGIGRVIRTVVGKMLEQFDYVVADTWSWIDDVSLALLDEATLVLVVLDPLIPAVKSARLFLDLARKLGYPDEKMVLVINAADRRTGLRVDQIERALAPAIGHIPFDERGGFAAANRGVPLIAEERGSLVARGFAQLAQAVLERMEQMTSEEEEEDLEAEVSRRLLGRILQ
ncbi:MAG TPA: CobQ/CobB/MinD/ParA nucleotide binding domain-containing protein [Anaerolineae bacterium]|nr:CobQ/CobB/MinD/ParA nucleotide binding domain-containing protein [Anaerolineae bacterium]